MLEARLLGMLTVAMLAGAAPSLARAETPASVDTRLQAVAEYWLRTAAPHRGAIVMSDVKTGRILAWASAGSGDGVSDAYAPSASVFKLATVAALLDSGKANARTSACYAGGLHGIELDDLRDVPSRDRACLPLRTAVGHSVNLVIAKLALRHSSPAEVRAKAQLLGFEGVVPIDRRVAASHVALPTDDLGFARAAAGFWNGRSSALGVLFATQTLANGGVRVRFSTQRDARRTELGRAVSAQVAREMGTMMGLTTRSGTAAKVFRKGKHQSLDGVSVAAKTGTLVGDKPARMYSWFTGFAPVDKPEIAVTVLLGNDLTWRMKGNQVGYEMLAAYFARRPASRATPSASSASTSTPPLRRVVEQSCRH